MEGTSAPEEEMAPSEVPVAAAPGTPWGKIAAVLLILLIIISAIGVYYLANPPAGPSEVTPTCPPGYNYDKPTTSCVSGDTLAPTAVGSANKETVEIGEEITFTGTSSTDNVAVTSWRWNFGDGTYGLGGTTTKVYGFDGAYIVTLTASDALGNSDANDENLIRIMVLPRPIEPTEVSAPVAVVAVDNDVIRPGDTVFFDAASSWIFRPYEIGTDVAGGGKGVTTAAIAAGDTTVAVNSTTNYSIGDYIQIDTGMDSETRKIAGVSGLVITVDSGFRKAHASGVENKEVAAPLTRSFRETCTDCTQFGAVESDAMTYGWKFADGGTATGIDASHKFNTAGTYGVRLTATGYNGITATVYRTIHVLPPAISFPSVKNPDTIVRATFGGVAHLDPARAYDSASGEVLDQVYEKLIFYDRDSLTTFKPILSTNVPSKAAGTIDASGREYRFTIRQGVTFHNGNALTPSDIEYAIERNIISDFTGGPMWLLMEVAIGPGIGAFDPTDATHRQRVQDFVRVEGQDVVFNLTFGFPPFLTLVATWGSWIIDKETTIAGGGWPQTYDQATLETYNDDLSLGTDDTTMGTGPYMLESWDPGVQVVMKKNLNYWNAAANPNAVGTVVIKDVTEVGTRLLMLQNGDADFATVQADRKPQVLPLQQQGLVNIVDGLAQLSMVASNINFAIDPTSTNGGVLKTTPGQLGEDGIPVDFFTDANVRRGIAYCMDYDTLISQTLNGNGQQARGPIPEGLQGYDATSPVYTKDTAKATTEFQAAWGGAAWTTGFTFRFLYNEGNTVRQAAASMMSDCVNSLNTKFHTTTLGVPWATYLGDLIGEKWAVATIGWGADYADAHNFVQPYLDGRAGAFALFTNYFNASVNTLIDQGVTETDPAVRDQIYRDLQMAAYWDVPAIWLYQPTSFVVYRTWINGWYYNDILGSDDSAYYFAYTKG